MLLLWSSGSPLPGKRCVYCSHLFIPTGWSKYDDASRPPITMTFWSAGSSILPVFILLVVIWTKHPGQHLLLKSFLSCQDMIHHAPWYWYRSALYQEFPLKPEGHSLLSTISLVVAWGPKNLPPPPLIMKNPRRVRTRVISSQYHLQEHSIVSSMFAAYHPYRYDRNYCGGLQWLFQLWSASFEACCEEPCWTHVWNIFQASFWPVRLYFFPRFKRSLSLKSGSINLQLLYFLYPMNIPVNANIPIRYIAYLRRHFPETQLLFALKCHWSIRRCHILSSHIDLFLNYLSFPHRVSVCDLH